MSLWQGANFEVRRTTDPSQQADQLSTTSGPHSQGPSPNKGSLSLSSPGGGATVRTETVEAALNRLSKAYQTALECVGAWHRADSVSSKMQNLRREGNLVQVGNDLGILGEKDSAGTTLAKDTSNRNILVKVGRTARRTLEEAILWDPLIEAHLHAWKAQQGSEESPYERRRRHVLPPVLTSASHKVTVRQLAYLSLLNYADVLLAGCGSGSNIMRNEEDTVLDKGVVKPLRSFQTDSCWRGGPYEGDSDNMYKESELDTVRNALTALLDATALDGSDPITWLKLACVARRLGRLLDDPVSSTDGSRVHPSFLRHRRLEKYALQQGLSALPSSCPPDRLLSRAWKEVCREDKDASELEYDSSTLLQAKRLVEDHKPAHLDIELSRYSWSGLGRILLRACREGSDFSTPNGLSSCIDPANKQTNSRLVACPTLSCKISDMLTLPSAVLARLCLFLEPCEIVRLESTCRALSYSIPSARAITDLDCKGTPTKQVDRDPKDGSSQSEADVPPTDNHEQNHGPSASRDEESEENDRNTRVSKRLQTQLIESGKRSERSSRRSSVEYCLVTATLGCTPASDEYRRGIKETIEVSRRLSNGMDESQRNDSSLVSSRRGVLEKTNRRREEARQRISGSSLTSFLREGAVERSSPLHYLFFFVAHASKNVSDIFSSDSSGPMILSSCLMECMDLILQRCHHDTALVPAWITGELPPPNGLKLSRLDLFAIDLLYAELRFRRCDQDDHVEPGYDSDANVVSSLVSVLLQAISELDTVLYQPKELYLLWSCLKVRSYFLAATFYFWRGRVSRNISESRDMEQRGLSYIDDALHTMASLDGKAFEVTTPHLPSSTRVGHHWKTLSINSLTLFRNEIQASSVVLLAQERFLGAIAGLESEEVKSGQTASFDAGALVAIGDTLHERYNKSVTDKDAKYLELVDDFMAMYGDTLVSEFDGVLGCGGSLSDWFDSLIPSCEVNAAFVSQLPANPCILSILTVCLHSMDKSILRVLTLLSRVVTTLAKSCEQILQTSGSLETQKQSNDSDDDSSQVSDETDSGEDARSDRISLVKLRQYSLLMKALIDKIVSTGESQPENEEVATFFASDDFSCMLRESMRFCACRFGSLTALFLGSGDDKDDVLVYKSLVSVLHFIFKKQSGELYNGLVPHFVAGFLRIVVVQRRVVEAILRAPNSQFRRPFRLKRIRGRSDLVSMVCFDFARVASLHPVSFSEGKLRSSGIYGFSLSDSTLTNFCESLVWLFKTASGNEGSAKDCLIVPVSTAIIAFCGSAAGTGGSDRCSDMRISEFIDSDESAIEWLSDGEDTDAHWEEVLRTISCSVHCVNNTFGNVDEGDIVSYSFQDDYVGEHGPLLPLVVSRVLNVFADILLVNFPRDDEEPVDRKKAIWSDYPYGTQTLGLLLDSLLYKAYKGLHGFTLVHSSDNKDTPSTTPKTAKFGAESSKAAAQLYRCIIRAYSQGKKSPPKAALDTVMDALPPMEESPNRHLIHEYLFSTGPSLKLDELVRLVTKDSDWDLCYSSTGQLDMKKLMDHENRKLKEEDESMTVRRGISNILTQGALPSFQESGNPDDRAATQSIEVEFSRKFMAIVDNLSLGNCTSIDGWCKAAQCLLSWSDIIADRLGFSLGFSRNSGFTVPKILGGPGAGSRPDLPDLIEEQKRLEEEENVNWIGAVGMDLSTYVRHCWSSFSSLEEVSAEIAPSFASQGPTDCGDISMSRNHQILGSILAFVENQPPDFVAWQQAWGGMFVYALRKISIRCLSVGLYVAYSTTNLADRDTKIAEICELLGISLYAEISGSQVYGYPMRPMTRLRTRNMAEAALACFQRAVDVLDTANDRENRPTWDLIFMAGKCMEKIARTYEKEKFYPCESESPGKREYESHMGLALQAYSDALTQAKDLESKGFVVEQNGGSSHGLTEVFYRLHASRLKCLISAVDNRENEREAAELEGLRLTERFWYGKPGAEGGSIRDRVWAVIVDVVGAFVQCRLEHSFFHRSVYRQAQAMMWAPVLCDPAGQAAKGSLGFLPATRACQVRGLNFSTNAANSALSVIGTLCEKKRTQLCAVWVTNVTPATPFQVINSSVRKYDSLRGKYISAYIESLRLCNKKDEIESFLRQVMNTRRDLPSLFAASAAAKGCTPKRPHSQDSLLVQGFTNISFFLLNTIKRQTNTALAHIIQKEIEASTSNSVAVNENFLKAAYLCFLRLNCYPNEFIKSRSWRYHRKNASGESFKVIVELLTTAYLRVSKNSPLSGEHGDWSGDMQVTTLLERSLAKCKELFPNLSSGYNTLKRKKQTSPKKKKTEAKVIKKAFDATVPAGLSAGDTFVVTLTLREGEERKVRLTVPDKPVKVLRFSLEVPVDEATLDGCPSPKKRRDS